MLADSHCILLCAEQNGCAVSALESLGRSACCLMKHVPALQIGRLLPSVAFEGSTAITYLIGCAPHPKDE